jgi:hypothetical protein
LTACASFSGGSIISLPAAGVDQPARDFVNENDRRDEIGGARPLCLSDRETGRDVVARMARQAADIGIVQIVITEGNAVREGGKLGRAASGGSDDGSRAVRRRERDVAADAYRSFVERCDPAADRIDHMGFDPLDGRLVDIREAQPIGVVGEPFRERADRLRARGGMDGRQRGCACRQMQESPASRFHEFSPIYRFFFGSGCVS